MSVDARNYIVAPCKDVVRAMLSVVIPTYNEVDNIAIIVPALIADLQSCSISHEIIVVDDDSPDFTWKRVQELALRYPQVRIVRRQGERGLGSAVMSGWQIAKGEYLGIIDADGQHPVENLSRLYQQLTVNRTDADVAIASRYMDGGSAGEWSRIRHLFSWLARAYGYIILPDVLRRVTDSMSGCFVVRRHVITDVPIKVQGFKILLEILNVGRVSAITEVAYTFRVRDKGKSKASMREMTRYFVQVLRLRWYRWFHKSLA